MARRPFHPTRLAPRSASTSAPRRRSADAPLEGLPGDGGGGEVAAATAAAPPPPPPRRSRRGRNARSAGRRIPPSPPRRRRSSSAAAVAAAAAAAAAAARLLSSRKRRSRGDAALGKGPFRGVTRSAGVVWLASRPAQSGVCDDGRGDRARGGVVPRRLDQLAPGPAAAATSPGGFRIDRDELARWSGMRGRSSCSRATRRWTRNGSAPLWTRAC